MNESSKLEYKEKVTPSFLKTVSAFANYGGGEIIFGVTDYGIEKGVEDPEAASLAIENMINDSLDPRPDYSVRVDGSSGLVLLSVLDSPDKPYLYKSKAYKRSGTSTVPVDNPALRRLSMAGLNLNYEDLEYSRGKLSFEKLKEEFAGKLGIEELSDDVLKSLGLETGEGKFNNAAAVMADANAFPGIDIVLFGDSFDEILDRKSVQHCSVFDCYHLAVEAYETYYQKDVIKGLERKTVERIPEKAFREAVANALVHRDWDSNDPVAVSMQKDRIEIISPGGLPEGVTEGSFLRNGVFSLRNPIIASIFSRLNYIEMFGTGTSRIISAYSGLDVKPVFEVMPERLIITLPVTDGTLRMTSDEAAVRNALSIGGEMSSSEVKDSVGFSRDKTIRMLNSLVKKNYIHIKGNGRGTKYTI